MRTSNYIKRLLLKEWLPIIGIFLAVSILSFVIQVSATYFYDESLAALNIVALSIPVTIFAIVMPFFVYSYRFSKKSGDTYYQLPFSVREFKNIRVIVGLIAVLGTLIVAFIIGYLTFVLRYLFSPQTKTYTEFYMNVYGDIVSSQRLLEKATLNIWIVLASLPVMIVFTAGQYFITCLTLSVTTRLPSSLFLTIVCQLVLCFFLTSIFTTIETVAMNVGTLSMADDIAYKLLVTSPGLGGANAIPDAICMGKTFNQASNSMNFFEDAYCEYDMNNNPTQLITIISSISLDAVIFGAAGFYTFFEKDPSGELNGNSGARFEFIDYLIYLLPLTLILVSLDPAISDPFSYAIVVVFGIGALYLFVSIYLGTFKIKPGHIGAIIGSGVLAVILPIIVFLTHIIYLSF